MSQKNPFDKASRYAACLDPAGYLGWLLRGAWTFRGWLNTRTLTFPGQPDRTCDTVAHLLDDVRRSWAVPVEFQLRPDPQMFGRFLGYLGSLWLEQRPGGEGENRYQVGAVLINLTGVGAASRDMRWPKAGLRTCLGVSEHNLSTRKARSVLRAIRAGRVSRCVLPWIPLMTGGAETGTIAQWKQLAAAEPDTRKRSDYGALALVFAEAAGRRAVWKRGLEGWNMIESQQVLEWMAEGEAKGEVKGQVKGRIEQAANKLLRLLELKFTTVPADLTAKIRATTDLAELDRWFDAAFSVKSLPQIRKLIRP